MGAATHPTDAIRRLPRGGGAGGPAPAPRVSHAQPVRSHASTVWWLRCADGRGSWFLLHRPRHVIVSVPTTGWGVSAGQHGPGVALFLELARRLLRDDSSGELACLYTFHFVAISGSEFSSSSSRGDPRGMMGNLGYDAAIREAAARGLSPDTVKLWLNLGDAIAVGPQLQRYGPPLPADMQAQAVGAGVGADSSPPLSAPRLGGMVYSRDISFPQNSTTLPQPALATGSSGESCTAREIACEHCLVASVHHQR
jgi:hypothetical protein